MGMEPVSNSTTLQAQGISQTMPVSKSGSATTEGSTTNSTTAATAPRVDSTTATVVKRQEGEGGQGNENQEQNGLEALKKAVESINKNLSNAEAVFGFHETTNRVTIKIVDKDTKELIREMPPEKTLDMIVKVWELAGLLVDEKR
ncbi:MAG: flagellar protein FlaG [Lachnospiraceae bacterium]